MSLTLKTIRNSVIWKRLYYLLSNLSMCSQCWSMLWHSYCYFPNDSMSRNTKAITYSNKYYRRYVLNSRLHPTVSGTFWTSCYLIESNTTCCCASKHPFLYPKFTECLLLSFFLYKSSWRMHSMRIFEKSSHMLTILIQSRRLYAFMLGEAS